MVVQFGDIALCLIERFGRKDIEWRFGVVAGWLERICGDVYDSGWLWTDFDAEHLLIGFIGSQDSVDHVAQETHVSLEEGL
jgi:hypothetical protein